MKKHFLTLILLLPLLGYSQNNDFWLGVFTSNETTEYDIRDESERGQFVNTSNYSVGINTQYLLTAHVFLNSGINYNNQKYVLDHNYSYADNNDPLTPKKTEMTFKYLRIPIFIGVQLKVFKKLHLSPSGGFQFGYLVKSSEKTTYENQNINYSSIFIDNINPLRITINVNIGIEYLLKERIKIIVTPFLSNGLNVIAGNKSRYSSTYGITLGLYFKV